MSATVVIHCRTPRAVCRFAARLVAGPDQNVFATRVVGNLNASQRGGS